ncbi:MAG: ATP-binding protein, partial [Deltaproteobacteria bacterium]|nr:ATP-binding protein [Deltaproteobacteria bacterium]
SYRHLSIGKLIGEISEGINGPCGLMAARSEVLTQEALERGFPEQFIKGLEIIKKSSHQLAQITKTLSTLSKHQGYEMKPLDLNQLVEENVLLMERGFKERGIKVEKSLMPCLPLIQGDPYELKGVLINLISNAMDALPRGGTIVISTQLASSNGGVVECTITDNGGGIPKENLERIFNPFFTTKQNTGGIGLGLSTSLSVMKKYNGLITVKSRVGEGASFSLSFPSHRA